jgi:serine/threonine protein kinase/tetratricopeptide (TPR) repeat protein
VSKPVPTAGPELAHTLSVAGQPDRAEVPAPVPDTEADAPLPCAPGYELLEEVGRGGMGVVYRARDLTLNREVAVKILHKTYRPDSAMAGRFAEETRITAWLQHPGIPAVYQVGALADGRPFLAMKLIRGRTLEDLLQAEGPGATKWLGTFESICNAVGSAHASNVLHRDLKPANVMVGAFGEVQVMDWGLAKVLAPRERTPPSGTAAGDTLAVSDHQALPDSDGSFTQAGSVLGTPAYMPPEQAAGEVEKIDLRADVFGLGAILCIMLTGKPPYEGVSIASIRAAAVRGQTEDAFRRLDACGADPGVVAVCKRCLSFEPADRPANADAVAKEINHIRAAADERARQAERDKLAAEVRTTEQQKRRRVVERAVAAVALIMAAGVTVSLWQAKVARREAFEAETARQETEQKRIEAEGARQSEFVQRKAAEAKEAEAKAVLAFLDDKVFAAVRPEHRGGLGERVTLREAIISSLPELATRFADQPLVEARLRLTLAIAFREAFDGTRAVEQGERAWTLYKRHLGTDHPDAVKCASELVHCYRFSGDTRLAAGLLEELLAVRRRVLPADHADTSNTMDQLAYCYMNLHRPADAAKIREELLSVYQRTLPPGHSDTTRVMGLLAGSYYMLDRKGDHIKLWEDIVALDRATYGTVHRSTLANLTSLAGFYKEARRYDDALKTGAESVAVSRALFGLEDHMTLSRILVHARLLHERKRGREALPLLDEVFAIPPTSKTKWLHWEYDLVWYMLRLRVQIFQDLNDPEGCRESAERAEAHADRWPEYLYNVGCFHAVAANQFAGANRSAEAKAEADKAMSWLTRAVAGGYRDRGYLEQNADLAFLRDRADFQTLLAPLRYIAPPPRPKPEK